MKEVKDSTSETSNDMVAADAGPMRLNRGRGQTRGGVDIIWREGDVDEAFKEHEYYAYDEVKLAEYQNFNNSELLSDREIILEMQNLEHEAREKTEKARLENCMFTMMKDIEVNGNMNRDTPDNPEVPEL